MKSFRRNRLARKARIANKNLLAKENSLLKLITQQIRSMLSSQSQDKKVKQKSFAESKPAKVIPPMIAAATEDNKQVLIPTLLNKNQNSNVIFCGRYPNIAKTIGMKI